MVEVFSIRIYTNKDNLPVFRTKHRHVNERKDSTLTFPFNSLSAQCISFSRGDFSKLNRQ